jgi:hypothetical protein
VTSANRHVYSDTPHLKSRALIEALGEYSEGLPMEQCELEYQNRFLQQDRFCAAFLPQYMNRVFVHIGEAESFRTRARSARLERKLHAFAAPLRERAAPAFKLLRLIVLRIGRLLFLVCRNDSAEPDQPIISGFGRLVWHQHTS